MDSAASHIRPAALLLLHRFYDGTGHNFALACNLSSLDLIPFYSPSAEILVPTLSTGSRAAGGGGDKKPPTVRSKNVGKGKLPGGHIFSPL